MVLWFYVFPSKETSLSFLICKCAVHGLNIARKVKRDNIMPSEVMMWWCHSSRFFQYENGIIFIRETNWFTLSIFIVSTILGFLKWKELLSIYVSHACSAHNLICFLLFSKKESHPWQPTCLQQSTLLKAC